MADITLQIILSRLITRVEEARLRNKDAYGVGHLVIQDSFVVWL